MKKLFGTFFRIIFLGILVMFGFAGIDYYRMTKGNLPVFQVPSYNTKTRVQTFQGTFYTAQRVVRANPEEPLEESSNVSFYLFVFPIDIKVEKGKHENDYKVIATPMSTCEESTLIYADTNIKVYTYCLTDIQISSKDGKDQLLTRLETDPSTIEEIKGRLAYMGLLKDGKTQQFDSREGEEIDVRIYQCDSLYVPDVYIGPKNMEFQKDFCTFKDDDFYFLYEITDETPEDLKPTVNEEGEEVPEVFYEDDIYRYEFSVAKSQFVFITTPAVRGKEETKTPLKTILSQKVLTIEQLEQKGLTFNKIDKAKEAEEKKKKEEEKQKALEAEKQKALEEEQKKNTPQS